MDIKQNFLETVRWGNPKALVNEWEALTLNFDPLMGMVLVATPGQTLVDPWGVTMHFGEGEPGPIPINTPDKRVCPDITRWDEYVKVPDIAGATLDWTGAQAQAREIRAGGKLAMSLMATGLFEQSHFLMGFEDTLINLIAEKDAMHALLDAILEYKLTWLRLLIKNNKPDVILSHDDFGTKASLFMSPELWREFYKPRYEKLYRLARENDIIVIHHADSYGQQIAGDLAEAGAQVWQGVLPQNDIKALQKELKGKMVLMGGIDAAVVDYEGVPESTVRKEVRRACEEYAPAGGFIPCLTYGLEGSIYPGVNDIIMDEIRALSPKYFK